MNNRKHKLKYFRRFPSLGKYREFVYWVGGFTPLTLVNEPISPTDAENLLTGQLGTIQGITYTMSETVKNTRYYRNKARVQSRKFDKDYPAIAFMREGQSIGVTRKFLLPADTGPYTFDEVSYQLGDKYTKVNPNLGQRSK